MEKSKRTEKGVTLIELVIALVISTVFLTGIASYIQGSNLVLNNISLSDNVSVVRINLQSLLINKEAWELTSSKDAFLCINLENCTGSIPFAVYDGTDTLYYDSNDPRAGFDVSGKTCRTYPDGECSIKYDVNFSVICSTCVPKQIKINIDYVNNSSSRHNSSFVSGGNFELIKNQ